VQVLKAKLPKLPRRFVALFGFAVRMRGIRPDDQPYDPELEEIKSRRVELEIRVDLFEQEVKHLRGDRNGGEREEAPVD